MACWARLLILKCKQCFLSVQAADSKTLLQLYLGLGPLYAEMYTKGFFTRMANLDNTILPESTLDLYDIYYRNDDEVDSEIVSK
jgi:hypothetical protein